MGKHSSTHLYALQKGFKFSWVLGLGIMISKACSLLLEIPLTVILVKQ